MVKIMELGFAVKVLGPDGAGLPTHDARRPQNHPNLATSLKHCHRALDWLEVCGIRMWRLSSDLAPFATHPERPEFHGQTRRYRRELREFGARLQEIGMRTSLHPSQYILLSSPDPGVTARSIADLVVQAELLDGMEVPGVIVLHAGGKYGDPAAAMERTCAQIAALPEPVRRRLVLENDDRVYSAREVHALCLHSGVPMVFDLHHHRCHNPDGDDAGEMLQRALATWADRPKVHLSSGRDHATDRAHAAQISDDDWRDLCDLVGDRDLDVMIEAKAKEHAVLDLAERIRTGSLPRPPALEHMPAWPAA